MENQEIERVKCPHCGHSVAVSLVRVLTPGCRWMKDLFSGRLNCVTCSTCRTEFLVSSEIIYRDAELGLILVQEDFPQGGDISKIVLMVDAMATEAASEKNMARPTVRLVFNRQDFLEKMFLFKDHLDDRLIEYAKYQLFQNSPAGGITPQKHRLFYDPNQSNDEYMQFMIFNRSTKQMESSMQVPRKEYDAMAAEFDLNPELSAELDRIFPNCFVTVDHLFEEERDV